MKRDEENSNPKNGNEHHSGITRRELIRGASVSLGIATTMGIAGTGAAPAQDSVSSATGTERVTTELPFDPVAAPEVKEYATDILVIGAGFAGIPAAVTARDAGKSVLIVDKGHPGYSGCSPFPQCYQFFDAHYGDSASAQTEMTMRAGEYIANLDWYKIYLEESRSCFDQLVEWGIYTRYPKASEGPRDYYATKQEWEYHQKYAKFDRRAKWLDLLEQKGIRYVDHTMIMDVIERNGRVVSALGLHVPSGALITFKAKAVILCMGIGSYKNAGYPVSGNSFDHEWIAWRHGIPVTGKEWDHLEATSSVTPNSCWRNYSWGYLENIHATAGLPIDIPLETYMQSRPGGIVKAIADATEGIAECTIDNYVAQGLGNSHSTDPNDPRRTGNNVDPMPLRNIYGASVGMGIFKNNGVFCGIDDLVGYTGLPGLYVAGDAHASMMYGATYTPGQGGSVSVSHIQGRRSAKAACAYINSAQSESIDATMVESLSAEILAPMKRKKGINPRWACDVLQSAMAPWWVQIAKNESTLKSALLQVEYLRDKVVPLLVARDPHDLRLCHEVAHKVLDAEMKLRASLERKESRGASYRTDYPFRDDKNFLCYITLTKGKQGEMVVGKVPVKDAWKGDTGLPYEKRYISRFPGEAKALGLKA
jgi:succinate dehydrogenase/fumarate reductase flavoprotein subunit